MKLLLHTLLGLTLPVLGGCVTLVGQEAWHEGQVQRGKFPAGSSQQYRDLDGRLVRLERRDPAGHLVPGPAIQVFSYDDQGRLTRLEYQDAGENLVLGDDGYALEEIRYDADETGRVIEDHRYFDPKGRPTVNAAGAARMVIESSEGKTQSVRFFAVDGRPGSIRHRGVEGTSRVEYAYLDGLDEVVFAVFRDVDGGLLERKKLSGLEEVKTSTSYSGGYVGYFPPFRPSASGPRPPPPPRPSTFTGARPSPRPR